jgi:hypothetical protein
VLFLLTCVLAVTSLVSCQFLKRFRLVGALCGAVFALFLFLFLAWWHPFHDHPAAVHLGLLALGVAPALLMWRGAPAVRSFGAIFALTMVGLTVFSAAIFPALTRPENLARAYATQIEAVVGDTAFCTVAARQQTGVNPSFYAVERKMRAHLDWSSPTRFLYSWVDRADRDLTLFVRTGEPQLRVDSEYRFEGPGNFYDLAVYVWDAETETFRRPVDKVTVGEVTHEASAIPNDSFPCIPRKGYLLSGPPKDEVEFSTPYGDFAVPKRLRPDHYIPGWYFSTRTDGFYFTLPGADVFSGLENPPALDFDFDPYDRPEASFHSHVYGPDDQRIDDKAGLEAVGFAENRLGLLAAEVITAERSDNEMLAFDAAGNIVTSIDCSPEGWCRHGILGPTVLPGPGVSNTLWVSYPVDLLPHWRKIEAAARAALVTFPVPGVVAAEKLGRRPAPDCIAIVQNDGRCLAYDRLP